MTSGRELQREAESRPRRRLAAPLREFIATQNSSAVILLAATLAALVWANSPWVASYEQLWGTALAIQIGGATLSLDLRHWINDGLMALFFFVAGLEIRRELDMGDLRERRRIASPVIAAFGGMVVPALLYLAFTAGQEGARGWGITMGTDTAFALGILAVVGGKAVPRVRTFLLTVVIVDDILALTVIALVYTDHLSLVALAVALGLFTVVALLRRSGMRGGSSICSVSPSGLRRCCRVSTLRLQASRSGCWRPLTRRGGGTLSTPALAGVGSASNRPLSTHGASVVASRAQSRRTSVFSTPCTPGRAT